MAPPRPLPARRGLDERNALAVQYLPLVGWAIRRWFMPPPRGIDPDDLFQEGCRGLLRAAELYDPVNPDSPGGPPRPFITYAVWAIRRAIHSYLDRAYTLIAPPRGLPGEQRQEMLARLTPLSLDQTAYRDILADPGAPDPVTPAMSKDAANRLHRALACVPASKRRVLRLRLQGLTLAEIAHRLNRSRERVRQIEADGLRILRDVLRGE